MSCHGPGELKAYKQMKWVVEEGRTSPPIVEGGSMAFHKGLSLQSHMHVMGEWNHLVLHNGAEAGHQVDHGLENERLAAEVSQEAGVLLVRPCLKQMSVLGETE